DSGVFTARLEAVSTTNGDRTITTARLSDINFADVDATWLELATAEVSDVSINPSDGAVRVKAIEIAGPAINVYRDADGALHAFGLKTASGGPNQGTPAAPAQADASPDEAPTQNAAPVTLPRVQIDRFVWKDIHLNFEDSLAGDALIVLQGRAGVEAERLVFDPGASQAGQPGQFKAWLELPGVVDRLSIDGSVQPTSRGVSLTSAFRGDSITGSTLSPYLKPLGIELTLTDGQVTGNAAATIATEAD